MLYWARALFFIQYALITSFIFICFYSVSHTFTSAYKKAMNSNYPQVQVVARHEDVRQQLGEYGQKYLNPSIIMHKLILPRELFFQKAKGDDDKKAESSSELTGFSSNPKNVSSPFGVHGNNYSLYDINNPSGQFGRLH